MKIAFFATQWLSTWAGSEELWYRTARLALAFPRPSGRSGRRQLDPRAGRRRRRCRGQSRTPGAGATVPCSVCRWPAPKIGSDCGSDRVGQATRLALRLVRLRLERFRIWGALASWGPDVVCANQGGTYDMAYHGVFTRFLNKHGVPYIVICHWNDESPGLPHESLRRIAIDYLSRARIAAFVSERNRRVTERQLAAHLPNALVVRNPVNLANLGPVPYPNSEVIKMANVARFDASCKRFAAEGVLLQTFALSGEGWLGAGRSRRCPRWLMQHTLRRRIRPRIWGDWRALRRRGQGRIPRPGT